MIMSKEISIFCIHYPVVAGAVKYRDNITFKLNPECLAISLRPGGMCFNFFSFICSSLMFSSLGILDSVAPSSVNKQNEKPWFTWSDEQTKPALF